jgi:hypothetical protein
MSLEQAIHARWTSDGTLTALVPVARFVTGKALGGLPLPCATLSRVGQRRTTRTSSRSIAEVQVRFDVFAFELGTLRQVADAVKARFDRATFGGGATVLGMRRADESQEQADDGTWRLSLAYVAVVESS